MILCTIMIIIHLIQIRERKKQELLQNQEGGNRLGEGTSGSSKSRLLKGGKFSKYVNNEGFRM